MVEDLPKKRGRYSKSDARRRQILDTALQVFGESGFRAASIRQIAERVGLSETGTLHHFGGKVALLEAVLAERDEADGRDAEGRDGEGLALIREIVAKNAGRRGVVRLFATLSGEATDPDHPAHHFFHDRYERVRTHIADTIRLEQSLGRMPARFDPVLSAQTVMAVMDGLQTQWLLDEKVDMVAAFDDFLERFFGGAGVHGA